MQKEALKSYGEDLTGEIESLQSQIYALAGKEFNILSPKQLGEVLFEDLKLPGAKKTKSGYSTAAEVLEKLSTDYPIVEKVLSYRQLTKLKIDICEGLLHVLHRMVVYMEHLTRRSRQQAASAAQSQIFKIFQFAWS